MVLGATRVYRVWGLTIVLPAVLMLLAQLVGGAVNRHDLTAAGLLVAEATAIYLPVMAASALVWSAIERALVAAGRPPRKEGRSAQA